ncbi:tRNA threonylcarbamoyl adenosine modification protein (Sua5/YciO/YrdC/YwlC family) [Methylohalomonas lacus]|uniref:tRNA threonylcarbamoyl adenosine modification protein (Sua5/YciO/YrdC/YwlC family) n=1 Tax=Methylohalomonas lacus TaxID=398773 RepID=A0AAE3HKP8_9GAMM|nr:L-threonylcarbamoyladenylate synthase [Methylohalomonas lacus]MCS3902894.1 tRNA threonylcarbamoyl adenosine modification protein (Sua5/YciO/YrdC/YwlC family) [Methylohalomonas lacus]
MAQYFEVNSDNPQKRLLHRAVEILRGGGVGAYPTDSCYALGCLPGDKQALERIQFLRQLDEHHNLTLLCADLSEIGQLAKVDNSAFRLMRSLTPGPYTFLLPASRDVPRRLRHPKRKTIGIRIPADNVARGLLAELGGPLMTTSLVLPDAENPLSDPEDIRAQLDHALDFIMAAGARSLEQTTVLDLVDGEPVLVRQGLGDVAALGLPA